MDNDNIGKITISELRELQTDLKRMKVNEGMALLRKLSSEKGLSDQETLAVARMARNFKYDGPRVSSM